MSRADSLAGLTEAIAGHDVATFEETPDGLRAKCNRCDERLEDGHAYVFDACRAHVAAVALAWLEGHGWAEGAEEWGVRLANHSLMPIPDRATAEGIIAGAIYVKAEILRRTVTAWVPVETGEDAR